MRFLNKLFYFWIKSRNFLFISFLEACQGTITNCFPGLDLQKKKKQEMIMYSFMYVPCTYI